jgi:transposase
VIAPRSTPESLLNKTTELSVRLKLSEELNRKLKKDLEDLEPLREANARLQSELTSALEKNAVMAEDLRWFRSQMFGRSSEKRGAEVSVDQRMLFNEAEICAAIAAAEEAAATRTVSAHTRKVRPGGRPAIPAHLPRKEIVHELSFKERACCGDEQITWLMQPIGRSEPAERYHYEPAKVWVEQHIQLSYTCPCGHEGVRTAPAPHILPKTNASASLMAQVVTDKFVDGLPVFRISRKLERIEVNIGATTLGSWINALGEKRVAPIIELLNEEFLKQPYAHIDETTLRVLRNENRESIEGMHYMAVRAAGPPGERIVLFNYLPARNQQALRDLLKGKDGEYYRGILLSDGLNLYDGVCEELKLIHAGCLTHCRRYFDVAAKVSDAPSGKNLARVARDDFIGKVYALERKLKEQRKEREAAGGVFTLEEVLEYRTQHEAPVMQAFKAWIDDLLPGVTPSSKLGEALSYASSQWKKINRFLEYPILPLDNNHAEQQIKHFVTGRKGWLFVDSAYGATASANLYSLVMSAKAIGLEPYAYLHYLFEHLPSAQTREALQALMPWHVKAGLKAQLKLAATAPAG